MSAMASQITSLTIVYSTVYSGADKETSKLRVTDLCDGNSPVTCEFPAQRASNTENASIWWRHHASGKQYFGCTYHHKIMAVWSNPHVVMSFDNITEDKSYSYQLFTEVSFLFQ